MDAGYAVLDVRSELESGSKGKLRGSVMIPCVFQRQQVGVLRIGWLVDCKGCDGWLKGCSTERGQLIWGLAAAEACAGRGL